MNYVCPQRGGRPTIIARYGDEGHEYLSGDGAVIVSPLRLTIVPEIFNDPNYTGPLSV